MAVRRRAGSAGPPARSAVGTAASAARQWRAAAAFALTVRFALAVHFSCLQTFAPHAASFARARVRACGGCPGVIRGCEARRRARGCGERG